VFPNLLEGYLVPFKGISLVIGACTGLQIRGLEAGVYCSCLVMRLNCGLFISRFTSWCMLLMFGDEVELWIIYFVNICV
jgi:hypothetical protein